MTPAEMNKIALTRAVENSAEQLERAAALFADYAEKLQNRAKDLRECGADKFSTRADRMSWAINDIENCMRNINFSTLARYCGQLSVAESGE